MSDLNKTLRQLEASEANLSKLETIWERIRRLTPQGVVFGGDPEYEDAVHSYEHILASLPMIDGWKPHTIPEDHDAISQARFDVQEYGDPEMIIPIERSIEEPATELREYRFRFNLKRRELIRLVIKSLTLQFEAVLRKLHGLYSASPDGTKLEASEDWSSMRKVVSQIDALLGSSVPRPRRWDDMIRHLRFAQVHDLNDIRLHDWPEIMATIDGSLFAENEPIPVGVADLAELTQIQPGEPVATELSWSNLSADGFERLVFALIASETGYENAEWLMKTNAADRGRDLSVTRVIKDPLTGTRRERVLIQCRHQLSRTISPSDISSLRDLIKQWEPPLIDALIVATSGRFSADAVAMVERHNASDTALKIHMWPESHLERLLAARPALIAEFQLR